MTFPGYLKFREKNDLEGRQLVGADAGADTGSAGSAGVQSLSFHHSEVVARSKVGFQEKR